MVANNFWSRAAAVALYSFLHTNLEAQGSWYQTSTSGPSQELAAHAAAYDMEREHTLVFGGFDPGYTMQGLTLRFDGVNWTTLTSPTEPSPRAAHSMAYDSFRERVVLFGGLTAFLVGLPLGDTWEHDGTSWIQRSPAVSPPARLDHAMSYDMIRQRVVLCGGRSNFASMLGDTWEWDGTTWANVSNSGPSPRFHLAMCFDLINDRTVMFGGKSMHPLDDTWLWDGTNWQQAISAIAPSPRAGHAMAYDLSRAVCVLHGGGAGGAETWEWDGAIWSQHGSSTDEKIEHALVYDARFQRSTQVGGMVLSQPIFFTSEVENYGHTIPGAFIPHGTSCPGSTGTPQLNAPVAAATGPTIGQTSVLQVMPSWFHTFFAFGWSDTFDGPTQLPLDLTAYGMPGCSLQVSRDTITSAISVNGVASISIPIANDPFMVGVRFFIQGFSLDLGANAGGFTTTHRIEAIVGRQ